MRERMFFFTGLTFILLSAGCGDILDNTEPSTAIPGEEALATVDGVNAVRASMYSELHGFAFVTRMMLGPDALADNTSVLPGASRFFGLNNNSSNNGERSGLNDTDTQNTYEAVYDLIQSANLILNEVEEGVVDEATLNRYRGEAHTLRAFAMHYLVRVLGYEPGRIPDSGPGAGFDLGIIIRTEPTIAIEDVDNRPRSTVEQVYEQIESDLLAALPLLEGQNNTEYVTEAFVQGLLARVYLYWSRYAEADSYATDAIATSGLSLVTDSAGVADMFDETAGDHPESVFTVQVNPSTESLGVNNSPNVYTATQWMAQIPTNSLIDLYEASDYRLGWYAPCFNDDEGSPESNCTSVNDEGWEIQKWNGDLGQYADNIPHMRIAELLLIQAEARLNTSGISAALAPLNNLREARGLTALSEADFTDNVALLDELLDERRRELVAEGHRFFDLKRLGRNIPFPNSATKISYNSHKILDDIDPAEVETNTALEQNPGY